MSDKVCPSCGHCKECGRGGIQFRPYPYYQPYQYPYTYWYTNGIGQTGVAGNVYMSSPTNVTTAGGAGTSTVTFPQGVGGPLAQDWNINDKD